MTIFRNKILLSCVLWILTLQTASADEQYMHRFETYQAFNQALPDEPTQEFIDFITPDKPLSNKLREKWLMQLASKNNWKDFLSYYRPSQDKTLECYAQIARYHTGQSTLALKNAERLWLSAESLPNSCDALFKIMLNDEHFDEKYITQRIILALDNRNLSLARYLMKQYKQPRLKEAELLLTIFRNPGSISRLQPGELNQALYLFGLKRMVSTNMDQALKIWKTPKTKAMLDEKHQQAFLAHVALYKAMRGQNDASLWFAKVKPQYYNEVLLDWQIRYALKMQNWAKVEYYINHSKDKDQPCWQYWLARSLWAQGKKKLARPIYEKLAKTRNYYGFLASLRLHKPLSFDNEKAIQDLNKLAHYQSFLEMVQKSYVAGDDGRASRLLNDFISELPKDEASALVYWVANDLQWPTKAIYLSSTDQLNNQLSLRFPLAYDNIITPLGQRGSISPEFIFAIIRQESCFKENATSSAGAKGLMQVMPRTAKIVASKEKIGYKDHNQLFDSRKNINIGVSYLNSLAKNFKNHPVLIAAAYNAGPRQVGFWLRNHKPKAMDIWIETLPWRETRNYLKNVISFFAVYQFRLHKKPDLQGFMKPLD